MIKKLLLLLFVVTYTFSTELILGILPQQSPLKLAKKWSSITQYLEKESGIKIIFKTEKSILEFEKKLFQGKYDIAYMNPYHFIISNQKEDYTAFLRAQKNIIGILLSRENPMNFSPENLRNKIFLFPSTNSFGATLLPKFELLQKHEFDIDKEAKVIYVNSHDSVYKGIAREIGYLGGGIFRTFNNFQDGEDKSKVSIVYTTKPYPSHPIAYHPRVNKDDVLKIEQAFLNMPRELSEILSIKKFIQITNSEYDIIKNIGLKKGL